MAGIMMKCGTVGEYYEPNYSATFESDQEGVMYVHLDRNDMTFISRDGGVSWEVAFEFLVEAAFLDFGNIIVAMHSEDNIKFNEGHIDLYTKFFTKFFFSVDQGRTWSEYHFEEPIHASDFELEVRDLKAYIGFSSFNKESIEYIFYTIDFSDAFGRTACTADDLETWYLSNGNCIDGMRYSFDRRKPDAKCLMRKTFEKLELHEEWCV